MRLIRQRPSQNEHVTKGVLVLHGMKKHPHYGISQNNCIQTKRRTMSTDLRTDEAGCWQRTREVISERWPQINREELAECGDCVEEMTQFVKERVDASADEVEAVVREFAPQESIVDRVTHAASEGMRDAAESAQFAHMRADECIAKRPTESVLTSFVAGIVLGATVTALWMRSTPEPTAWDRVKTRSWN